MKLNNQQIKALASSLYDQIKKKVEAKYEAKLQEYLDRPEVKKFFDDINFHTNNEALPVFMREKYDIDSGWRLTDYVEKMFGKLPQKENVPYLSQIQDQILLATIESENLEAITKVILSKYE